MQVFACMLVHELHCQCEGFHAERVVMPVLKDGLGNAEQAQGEEGDLPPEGLEVGGGSASNAISQVTGPQIVLVDHTMLQRALSGLPARLASGPDHVRITEVPALR